MRLLLRVVKAPHSALWPERGARLGGVETCLIRQPARTEEGHTHELTVVRSA